MRERVLSRTAVFWLLASALASFSAEHPDPDHAVYAFGALAALLTTGRLSGHRVGAKVAAGYEMGCREGTDHRWRPRLTGAKRRPIISFPSARSTPHRLFRSI